MRKKIMDDLFENQDPQTTPDSQELPEVDSDPGLASPEYVSQQEFSNLSAKIDGLAAGMQAYQSPAQEPTHYAPPAAVITEDQWTEAMATGSLGQLVNQVVEARTAQAINQLERDRIDPLEHNGMQSLTRLTAEAARGQMPYYDKFKDQIDQRAGSMPAQFRTDPQAYKLVHDAVVGENIQSLIGEEVERRIRGQREGTGGPGIHSGGMGGGNESPSVSDVFGSEAQKALGGTSADEFARSIPGRSYESFADYLNQTGAMPGSK